MSALCWWSSKSTYIQTVALVSNKTKDNKKRLCIIIRVIVVQPLVLVVEGVPRVPKVRGLVVRTRDGL
ncbi:hypothetical protein RGQ29_016178 [Quercus rubra]|uniref:Uncharacterized protein n=1 Tax=Quercus rubra TaxID=3512 RepID=A0AAN7IRQ7_QUERU|nr:hypothetical protein RGQ29_016178 [Quercus rubra]